MGDVLFLYIINNVMIFGLIFWFLNWGAEYFYTKKNHKEKKKFYECGFKSISELNIQINVNFSLMVIFLVLYDVEFKFNFPLFFNCLNINFFMFFIFFVFYFFIVLSLFYDYIFNALSWQI
jgi:NADH:ubiquinone oxidoreductase subunit 3 (subunit A)